MAATAAARTAAPKKARRTAAPRRSSPRRPTVVRRAPAQAARPKRRRAVHRSSFYKSVGVMIAIAALAMVTLSQRVLIAQDGLSISDLQRKIQNEKNSRQRLEMSLLMLESPSRIQRQAESKLRMIVPEEVSYMQIPLEPRTSTGRKPVPSTGRPAMKAEAATGKQGLVQFLLEEVSGRVQLLPLGNVGMPPE